MALTAKLLQLRPKSRPIPNPSFTHFFSSSDNEPNPNTNPTTTDATSSTSESQSQSQSSFSSYFSDVKASLKQQSPPPGSPPPRRPFNLSSTVGSSTPPANIGSLEEIRKNLSEFRRRAAVDDGKQPLNSHSQPISFQELYNRNVIQKGPKSTTTANQPPAGKYSFDTIRESLRQLRSSTAKNQADGGGQVNDSMSLSRFQESLKLRPVNPNTKGPSFVIGGSGKLPMSVFGKELRDSQGTDRDKDALRTEFLKVYNYPELGEKLRMLRPEKKDGKNWFTLTELNERLIKLREWEEKESESRIGGVTFKDLRESLVKLQISEDDKKKSSTMQRLDILGQIGGTPSFMMAPPKEHLVENYFHPDNMSSAEKLKLELKKVRDEFKMSESDCGSARVQVAQLTTKIKHLSTALHKKDKHSRKGLIAMVQKRKKLLKYLRRTDWDSYCLVLSKLGLRDNPDYKA